MFPGKMEFSSRAGVTQLVECDLAKVDVAGSNPVSRSNILALLQYHDQAPGLLLSCLPRFRFAQDYKLEPIATAAPGLPAAYASVIEATGYRVTGPPARGARSGSQIDSDRRQARRCRRSRFRIAQGTLLGVLRFPGKGADRRGQVIKAGRLYARYSNFPVDGAHRASRRSAISRC